MKSKCYQFHLRGLSLTGFKLDREVFTALLSAIHHIQDRVVKLKLKLGDFLTHKKTTDEIFEPLFGLKNLETLSLETYKLISKNFLNKIFSELISHKVLELKIFELDSAAIGKLESISNLTSLETLSLYYCNIGDDHLCKLLNNISQTFKSLEIC